MKLIKGKSTGVTLLKSGIKKTPSVLWSTGKRVSRNLNALNPQEDVEQEEKKKKRRKSGIDPTKFMSVSEKRKWEKLSDRKKEDIIRKARLTEEEKKNPAIFHESRETSARSGQGTLNRGNKKQLATIQKDTGITRINKVSMEGGKAAGKAGKSAVSAGRTAATTTASVTSAAATAGASLAADAAKKGSKKVAKKFREKLQMQVLQKSESIRLTEEEQKKKEERKETQSDPTELFHGTDINGLSATVRKVIAGIAAAISALVSAVASVVSYIILLFLVAFALVIVVTAFLSKTGGTGRQRMVEAALAEYQVADQNVGGTKYKNWYGLNDNWCGMFVAYCADECGYISSGIIVKSASVSESKSWYEAKGEYQTKESGYVPMPGDIIYFTNGMSHMGIVIEYDEDTDHVITIEGNSGSSSTKIYHEGSHVVKHEYPRTAAAISGYATPAYPDQVIDLEGGTNAEKVFNGLVAQGYSEAAAAGVVGNLYREAGVDASGDINIHAVNGSGTSIGMAQWTGGRKDAFLSFAAASGEPWPDTGLEVQLNYLLLELSSNQWMWTAIGSEYGSGCNMSLADFKNIDDPEFAARVFCAMFERCHLSNAALPYRMKKAMETYNAYAGM